MNIKSLMKAIAVFAIFVGAFFAGGSGNPWIFWGTLAAIGVFTLYHLYRLFEMFDRHSYDHRKQS